MVSGTEGRDPEAPWVQSWPLSCPVSFSGLFCHLNPAASHPRCSGPPLGDCSVDTLPGDSWPSACFSGLPWPQVPADHYGPVPPPPTDS